MQTPALFSSVLDWFHELISPVSLPSQLPEKGPSPATQQSHYSSFRENELQKVILQKASVGSSPKSLSLTAQFSHNYASALSMFFVTACSSTPNQERNDSWSPSPENPIPQDSGISQNLKPCDPNDSDFIDRDGDGFCKAIDCNDGNPDYIPLKNNEVISIDHSVTLCPGTYNNSKLIIRNSEEPGIEVKADGVSIDQGEIDLSHAYKVLLMGIAVHINGGTAITVNGNFNTLENLTLNGDYGTGLLVTGSNNKIINLNSEGLQNPIILSDGQQNSIQDCNLKGNGIHLNDYVELQGGNGEFTNNTLTGIKLLIGGPLYRIRNNNISGLDGYGIELDGDFNSIISNLSKNNGYGLYINVDACDNTIQQNDFRGNSLKPIFDGQGCNTISANQEY